MPSEDLPSGIALDRLWTKAECARYLGVHEKTIDRWSRLEKDPLPSLRFGAPGAASQRRRRVVRFRPDDVLAWVSAERRAG